MIALAKKILKLLDSLAPHAEAIIMVGLRIWIAIIFWQSGLTKISNWDTTVSLFADEYKVPLLPPSLAACFATAFELAMPVFLTIGFMARLATIPLLAMTAVIQFTYLNSADHLIWALFLLAILIKGAGLYSWDYFIHSKISGGGKVGTVSVVIALLAVISLTVIAGHEVAATQAEDITPWLETWNKFWFGK